MKGKSKEPKKGIVYISGPMSGWKDANSRAFQKRAKKLRKLNYIVISPPELDAKETKVNSWRTCIIRDIATIIKNKCTHISYLPAMEFSEGAIIEKTLVDVMGVKELDEYGEIVKRKSCLDIAESMTGGNREESTFPPMPDLQRTADFWSPIFKMRVTTEMVAAAMIAQNLSAELNKHKQKNLVDIAAYARILEDIHEKRKDEYAIYPKGSKGKA